MFCTCGSIIPEERIALGYINCIVCSEKQYVKPKGIMHFDHKTGAQIEIVSPEQFSIHRKYNPYGRYTGRGSGLHRVTKPTSCQ